MSKINISFRKSRMSRSVRIAGRATATIVSLGAMTTAAGATTVVFGQYVSSSANPLLISLAGSASPLYSVTYTEGRTQYTDTVSKCGAPLKFGGCGGPLITFDYTTTTTYNANDFNSLSPDALIGGIDPAGTMPTEGEAFSTNRQGIRYYGLTTVSPQPYSAIPFTPHPDDTAPLRDNYLHLKFAVDGVEYLGLAKFNGTNLGYIDYEAVSSPAAAEADSSAVPEPDSWMMLIAGFGLTGAALRRSRAVAQTAR